MSAQAVGTQVIILAAGQGKRMKSALPKVLHPLAGKPMLFHLLDTALSLSPKRVSIVVGHQSKAIEQTCRSHYTSENIVYIEQSEQLGTAHAVAQVVSSLPPKDHVIVLYGDVPLINRLSLIRLLERLTQASLALLAIQLSEPTGYGRICRDTHGCIEKIVEEKDADVATKNISEVNTGIMAVRAQTLIDNIPKISNDNAQAEFYLTDLVELCVKAGDLVVATKATSMDEVAGINSREQLAHAERLFQFKQANQLMQDGLALLDPHRFDLRGELCFGQDVMIDVNVLLEGNIKLGNNVFIGANCVLKNVVIEDGSIIHPFSHLEKTHVGTECEIGPYARCRSGTYLHDEVKLGNFVETKKTRIGRKSKLNHLSYAGNADIGESVNIGAGTIFCNYDGHSKHNTIISDRVFVGSNSALVAPVTIGSGVTIGAGSVIVNDVPADKLAIARARQRVVPGWHRPGSKQEQTAPSQKKEDLKPRVNETLLDEQSEIPELTTETAEHNINIPKSSSLGHQQVAELDPVESVSLVDTISNKQLDDTLDSPAEDSPADNRKGSDYVENDTPS